MKIKKRLVEELEGKIPESFLKKLPSRYPILGDALILRLDEDLLPYGREIGMILLEMLPKIKGVWAIITTRGVMRRPQTVFLAGKKNPIIIHKELNTLFKLDIERLTFSPGNRGERKRLIEIVRSSQTVVDMFACVGNLSLPIAVNVNIRRLYALEINPYAFRFLIENIVINDVQNRVVPILGNNVRFLREDLGDHVLMGFLPEPTQEQLVVALKIVRSRGVIHYHTLVKKGEEKNKMDELLKHIEDLGYKPSIVEYRIIKSFSPSKNHAVYRIRIYK